MEPKILLSQKLQFNTCLNRKQKSIINRPYKETAFGRTFSYFKENPTEVKNALLPFKNDVVGNAMVYGTLGIASAQVPNALKLFSYLSQYPTPENVKLGIAIGLGAFQATIICFNLHEICSSEAYLMWTKQHIKIMENAKIFDLLKEDDILRHLLCPISRKIPKIPATLKEVDITFDYDEVINWIRRYPGRRLPGTTIIAKESDFIFDYAHINTVLERLSNLRILLGELKTKKFFDVLGIKYSKLSDPSKNHIETFHRIIQICIDNKTTTLSELFLGHSSFRHNVEYIDSIRAHILSDCIPLNQEREQRYGQELIQLKKIWVSRTGEMENFYCKVAELDDQVSNIKTISVVQQIGIFKLYYDYFEMRQVTINREFSPKLREELADIRKKIQLEKPTLPN